MQNANDAIVHGLSVSLNLLKRYTQDFSPQDYLHRASPKANCTAWIIGHLILTERSALGAMGVTDLPTLPEGFESRIPRDESAATCNDFGDVNQLMPLFEQHRQRLIDAVKGASTELLNTPREKPNPLFRTVGEVANFMSLHVTMHAGQITMIRRSLGRPPLV